MSSKISEAGSPPQPIKIGLGTPSLKQVEKELKYIEISSKRIEQESRQLKLFR